jgi:hypothetical protein
MFLPDFVHYKPDGRVLQAIQGLWRVDNPTVGFHGYNPTLSKLLTFGANDADFLMYSLAIVR